MVVLIKALAHPDVTELGGLSKDVSALFLLTSLYDERSLEPR